VDVDRLLGSLRRDIKEVIKLELGMKHSVSVALVTHIQFEKVEIDKSNSEEVREYCIRDKNVRLSSIVEIANFIKQTRESVMRRIISHNQEGSGLVVTGVPCVDIIVGSCPPLNGYCNVLSFTDRNLLTRIKPHMINPKKINCFALSIARFFTKSLNKTKNSQFAECNFKGKIKGGFKLSSIKNFEKINSHLDIKINVVHADHKRVYPLICSTSEGKNIINLMFYQFKIHSKIIGHYGLVTNLSKICRTVYNYGNRISYYSGFRCMNCFTRFGGKVKADDHQRLCLKHKPQEIKMPDPLKEIVKFSKFGSCNLAHIIIFFDFESTNTIRVQSDSDSSSKTIKEKSQIPISYSILILDKEKNVLHKNTYSGYDAPKIFLSELLDWEKRIVDYINKKMDMDMSSSLEHIFKTSEYCHICRKTFINLVDKVRDHDHVTGKFLGAAHKKCNIWRKEKNLIPTFCHNLSGYDSHFILSNLGHDDRIIKIAALPSNSQKLKTFRINSFVFVDTLNFLQGSLDKLVQDLGYDHDFSILDQSKLYEQHNLNLKKLLLKKGVYPYEFATSLEILQNTTSIPPQTNFYSSIKNESVSSDDYKHATLVFSKFKCKNMLEYTNLYCQLDTFLLAEAFIAFRTEIFNEIGLDCARYISLPQLAYDSMLLLTDVTIQLIVNEDQYLFVESGIRGGLSFIAQRYCETNSKSKIKSEIKYIDANNLYGGSQTKPLPIGGYVWLTKTQIESFNINNCHEYDSIGYILEVDLDYPKHLHISHNSYPLAPERVIVSKEMMSEYSINSYRQLYHSDPPETKRLTATLSPKNKYIVHYYTLKKYLEMGLTLKKIHRVLQFNQSNFLVPYIDFCTTKRVAATTDFKKKIWKLFVNSCFGKFIESVRKYRNCTIVQSKERFDKIMSNPRVDSFTIMSKNVVIVMLTPPVLTLNKPIAIGMTILDRSKDFMYQSFYRDIKPKFPLCRVLFSDTDSLCIQIKSLKLINFNKKISHIMDFSNLPNDHPFFSKNHQNQLFYFKDEAHGQTIKKFVGLRAKSYAIETMDKTQTTKLKGVTKAYKKTFNFDSYLDCLKQNQVLSVTQYNIRSRDHQLTLDKSTRQALTSYDANRYLLPCGVHSYAYGCMWIETIQSLSFCPYCYFDKVLC
jgi:hypothetical protein